MRFASSVTSPSSAPRQKPAIGHALRCGVRCARTIEDRVFAVYGTPHRFASTSPSLTGSTASRSVVSGINKGWNLVATSPTLNRGLARSKARLLASHISVFRFANAERLHFSTRSRRGVLAARFCASRGTPVISPFNCQKGSRGGYSWTTRRSVPVTSVSARHESKGSRLTGSKKSRTMEPHDSVGLSACETATCRLPRHPGLDGPPRVRRCRGACSRRHSVNRSRTHVSLITTSEVHHPDSGVQFRLTTVGRGWESQAFVRDGAAAAVPARSL